MVSNLVIALLAESIDMLVKCGIEKNMAKNIWNATTSRKCAKFG